MSEEFNSGELAWEARSVGIEKLAAALSKAQAKLESAKKDSKNPFFNSSYADLASVWAAIREPLATNELSVVQEPSMAEAGKISITTTLMHSSGQYIRSSLVIPVTKQDAQGYGSAITYARRYALQSIVGIAPEDDDGNAAASKVAPPTKQPSKTPEAVSSGASMGGKSSVSAGKAQGNSSDSTFWYSIEKLEGEKFVEAEKLLKAAGAICTNDWGTAWKSPVEIKKLVNYRAPDGI